MTLDEDRESQKSVVIPDRAQRPGSRLDGFSGPDRSELLKA
jgi:hypothetical protein